MHEFMLPGGLVVWALFSVWAADGVGDLLSRGSAAWVHKGVVFIALLPLPLLDELLFKPQFESICQDKAVVVVHPGAAPGRPAALIRLPAEPVPGLIVPLEIRKSLLIDSETGRTLLSFNTLQADAGKLARRLGRPQPPLTFDGYCEPSDFREQIARLRPVFTASQTPGEPWSP